MIRVNPESMPSFERDDELESIRKKLDSITKEMIKDEGLEPYHMENLNMFDIFSENGERLALYLRDAIFSTAGEDRFNYIVSFRQLKGVSTYAKLNVDFNSIISTEDLEKMWQEVLEELGY
jgi:hypothetical protein